MPPYFLAKSDAEGRFAFNDLPARGWDMRPWGESEGASGAYTIAVKHEDYAAADTDIQLLPGQTVDDLVISVRTDGKNASTGRLCSFRSSSARPLSFCGPAPRREAPT